MKRRRGTGVLLLVLLLVGCIVGAAAFWGLLWNQEKGKAVKAVQEKSGEETKTMQEKSGEETKTMQEKSSEETKVMQEESGGEAEAAQEKNGGELADVQKKAGEDTRAMQKEAGADAKKEKPQKKERPGQKETIYIQDMTFENLPDNRVLVVWSVNQPQYVSQFAVMKRSLMQTGDRTWQQAGTVVPDTESSEFCFVDEFTGAQPQQYEYKVDISIADTQKAAAADSPSIPVSNMKVCLDPGHYQGVNQALSEPSYGYAEGDFTLLLAQELADDLKNDYGIDVCLTRTEGSITLGGYTDEELDGGHLSLRGEYAAENGCDLFLSLHMNANLENANGYDTYLQPLEINKTIVIANTITCASPQYLAVCNAIGEQVTAASCALGLSVTEEFQRVSADEILQWTDQYNDSLYEKGTVVYRMGNNGDYYGVLRGAAVCGVPGIIVEHGFYTVPEVRQQAMEGDLKEKWASADAKGIAEGYGFMKLSQWKEGGE